MKDQVCHTLLKMTIDRDNILSVSDIFDKGYTQEQAAKINSRYNAIMDVYKGSKVTSVCRKYNIDRTSFYKWQRRFDESGIDGLADLPPIHHTHPHTTDEETIEKIIRMALEPQIDDCKTISYNLKEIYGIKLSHVTVNKYLKKFSLHTWEMRSYSVEFIKQHCDIKNITWTEIKEILNSRTARLKPGLIKDIFLENGDILRINITTPDEGLSSFHIREWNVAGIDIDGCEIYRPSRKGISFPVHQVDEMMDVVRRIEVYLKENKNV